MPTPRIAAQVILKLIYEGQKAALQRWEKLERNAEIYRRYINGEDSVTLACAFGLSDRRIRSIISRERKYRKLH